MCDDKNRIDVTANKEDRDSIGKFYTVGGFFKEYNVCIPILQRDYAQGREGEKNRDIRERFLRDIKDAIENDKSLTLDFVYGYFEEGDKGKKKVFYPLDGQQRLTTIWLCYWYLALRAGKLSKEKDALCGFTYQTRKSSREFCEALCSKSIACENDLVGYIRNQTWFYSLWKNDPTIKAMLITLGGTNGKDGIEPFFPNLEEQDWKKMLKRFKENVGFCVQTIGTEKLPREAADSLYVKMNARGKALTDFENFKAELVDRIGKMKEESSTAEDAKDIIAVIPQKLDNEWNDIFWSASNAGEKDGKTDEIFFAFINRFCFTQLCIAPAETNSTAVPDASDGTDATAATEEKYLLISRRIDKIGQIIDKSSSEKVKKKKYDELPDNEKQALSRYLYFHGDVDIKYSKFDEYYKDLLDGEGLMKLSCILNRIRGKTDYIKAQLTEINDVVAKRGSDEKTQKNEYLFIPDYVTDKNGDKIIVEDENYNRIGIVRGTDLKERLYFFAVCRYFDCAENYDKEKFKNWLRFCRNVIENSGVESQPTMVSVMRKLDKFEPQDVLSALTKADEPDEKHSKLEAQIREEIKKAKATRDNNAWEKIEKTDKSFLCGKIGFLFTGEDGEEDWASFDEKWKRFESFFDGNTAKTEFVKRFAKSFESFDDVMGELIFHKIGWGHRGDSWLDVLSDEKHKKRVHDILMGNAPDNAQSPYNKFIDSAAFKSIVEKTGIFEREKNLRIAKYNDHYALYMKNGRDEKLFFDDGSFKRNDMLFQMECKPGFELHPDQEIVQGEPYFFGDSIYFKYNDKDYAWTSNDEIHAYDAMKEKLDNKELVKEASKRSVEEILSELKQNQQSSASADT